MPHQISKLTPNLIVSNVEQSVAFYRDVLGFTVAMTVPDAPPYVFAGVTSGSVGSVAQDYADRTKRGRTLIGWDTRHIC